MTRTATPYSRVRPQATILVFFTALLLVPFSCRTPVTPKPEGYLRVDYPEKEYRLYNGSPHYRFEIPTYAHVELDTGRRAGVGWSNVVVPSLDAKIHLSYKPVEDNLQAYITDSRRLVYKHTVKAEGIEESPFADPETDRFGIVYDLEGDVASAVQFFVTDSTTHFLRGSLYFNTRPNRDSLNPIIEFLRVDIIHMIETTEWKY